jgi:uncharacterized protein YeeX (DUF496 family)
MNRSYTIYQGNEIIESGKKEVTWDILRMHRDAELTRTDFWALKDLTMSQEKKDYRQTLRDLPQDYDTANEAADNFPQPPE